MGIQKFEDIIAWQKAQDLAVEIYKEFRELKDWGFKNQISDAVLSISNNIAEGFNRNSDKDFVKFLYYSLGSASEVKSMLYLSPRIDYCTREKADSLIKQVDEVSRITGGLIKKTQENILKQS